MLDKIVQASIRPRTLLLSTKNIVETAWLNEIEKWYPGQISYAYITGKLKPVERLKIIETPVDILALNVEMLDWFIKNTTSIKSTRHLKTGLKEYYNTNELIEMFDMIIIDESSLFKNYRSNRFKLLKNWCSRVKNVFILSATPTPKDIEDLWSQIYLLDSGVRLGKNITRFRENYATAIPMYNGQTRYEYSQQATDYVLTLVKDIVTSIPTPQHSMFPEPIIKRILITPDPATNELLNRFKQDYIIKLDSGRDLIAFSKTQLITKINQIASGNVYDAYATNHIHNLKFRAVQQLLSTIKTPVLILYVYVFDRDQLLTLPGARLLSSKEDFSDWNNNKIPIGILSPFSAAHGLNLQQSDCVDIIWFSPIWDTEKWIQTNARVCRRGQIRQVTIRILLLKNTFDEYAFNLSQDKFKAQYNNLMKLK